MNDTFWTLDDAIKLCTEIEAICPKFGCHVALTGGLLYKQGPRKDLDILFYRIRQRKEIDFDGLWAALLTIGFEKTSGFGWCYKATYCGRKVDCFSPEEQGGEYVPQDQRTPQEKADDKLFYGDFIERVENLERKMDDIHPDLT